MSDGSSSDESTETAQSNGEAMKNWNRDLDASIDEEQATNWATYNVTNVLPKGTLNEQYDLKPGEIPDARVDVPEDKYRLEEGTEGELMEIAVDPQDRIWVITRGSPFISDGDGYAEVAWVDPETGEHQLALEIPVIFSSRGIAEPGEASIARELGGQGIAIDPNFEENGYVYVMYHTPSERHEEWDNPYSDDIYSVENAMVVSRFEAQDDGTLDPDSETVVYEVAEQMHTCCHHGGYLQFGEGRELYITTGDNSNNVGHPTHDWPPDNTVDDLPDDLPVDELPGATADAFMGDERQGMVGGRPGPVADAQRTSGNTADKRGKVHRVVLNEDGSYDIPDGNLKQRREEETGESYSDEEFLPSIYVMGCRNPFTLAYDEHTGHLWTANYGNDAGGVSVLGPPGFGDYHLWCGPGNAGYPYFRAFYPYRDFDFETGEVGQPFWPDNLRNESVNNVGVENVPNITPAMFWHPQSFENLENLSDIFPWLDMPRPGEVTFPFFESGGSADVGVVYRHSEDYGPTALGPFFDGKTFIMRPSNSDVNRFVEVNDDGSLEFQEFLPNDDTISAAYDMELLSDGRLAVMGMYSGVHLVERSIAIEFEGVTQGERFVDPGSTVTLDATVTNPFSAAVEGLESTLTAPEDSDIEVSAAGQTTCAYLPPDASQSLSWEVSIPENAGGAQTLTAKTTYTNADGEEVEATTTVTVVPGRSLAGEWQFKEGDDSSWKEADLDTSDWQTVELPNSWEDHSDYTADNVFGWYRRTVTVPEDWEGQSVRLRVGRVDDVDETFVNGTKVGQTGSLPEDEGGFQTAYDTPRDYTVGGDVIETGENVIAVRAYDDIGGGGIYEGPLLLLPTSEESEE